MPRRGSSGASDIARQARASLKWVAPSRVPMARSRLQETPGIEPFIGRRGPIIEIKFTGPSRSLFVTRRVDFVVKEVQR